nr:ATP-binding protein [Desulfurispira natronophila]
MEKSVELEREVIHQAQLLDIVTNSVEDLICYKDLQLRYIGCNLAFSHFVGREQDEIIGKTDEDIFPESYARFFRQFEENVFQQNQSSVSLAWSWKQDKPETMRRFISNTSLLRGSTGSIFGLVTVSRDWTRQWQAEQKLANLNRHLEDRVQEEVAKNQKQNAMILQQSRHAIMGEMLSMIAHQWRQPLSAISMAIGTVDTYRQMGILGDEDISVAVKDIEQQTDYLSRVIEDFRNFFRPASTRETTSLAALVQRCLTLMAHLFERNNIILENHTALQDTVQVHTNEIIQVIMNILKNAFDVLQERNTAKGKVVLQDRAEGEYLYLQIKDNAGGIAPEHQGHIFDPYFSTKDSKNGTGLGLYMSKVIMEEHNHGTIRFWNGEEGAVFELQFHRGRCE